MKIGDAAALVEAVEHCHQHGEPIPDWVVTELKCWLAEFITLAAPPKYQVVVPQRRFRDWAGKYLPAVRDWIVAAHLEANVRVYGLTRQEALDEAECYFRGSPLAASASALAKAWQRALRSGRAGWFQRMPTHWEARVLFSQFTPESASWLKQRKYWNIINADREGGRRGEWRERPRLNLAHLAPAELEQKALALIREREKVRKKTSPKLPHT